MTFDVHVIQVLLLALLLVVVDWVMGVLASMRIGTFDLHLLPNQLATTVLPYIGSLSVLGILQALAPGQGAATITTLATGTFYGAAIALAPKLLLDIVDKAQVILGGGTRPPAPPASPSASSTSPPA